MKRFFRWFLGVAIILWLLTGMYQVQPGQIALIQRMGKLLPEPQASGLHYAFPWGIDTVHRIAISELRVLTVGFEEVDGADTADALQFQANSQVTSLLTGDNQLANLRVNVNFRVDPGCVSDFVISGMHRERLLRRAAEETLVSVLATEKVDAVLLGRAIGLESKLQTHLAERLKDYQLGIVIDSVNIAQAQPPNELSEVFRNVNRSRTEKETAEREAWSQREGQISVARQYARRVTGLAQANADQKRKQASAEAEAFKTLLASLPKDEKTRASAILQLYFNEMMPLLTRMPIKTISSDKTNHHILVPLPGR